MTTVTILAATAPGEGKVILFYFFFRSIKYYYQDCTTKRRTDNKFHCYVISGR